MKLHLCRCCVASYMISSFFAQLCRYQNHQQSPVKLSISWLASHSARIPGLHTTSIMSQNSMCLVLKAVYDQNARATTLTCTTNVKKTAAHHISGGQTTSVQLMTGLPNSTHEPKSAKCHMSAVFRSTLALFTSACNMDAACICMSADSTLRAPL